MTSGKVVIQKTRELDPAIATEISALDEAHFGSIPIVKKYRLSPTDWTIYVTAQGRMVSSAKIVERLGQFDQNRVRLGGVNNVITRAECRGQGFSSIAMRKANDFILSELKCDFGLLLCATELIPFYRRLGWQVVKSSLHFDQPEGKVKWEAETMILSKGSANEPEKIDLIGLPW